MDSLMNGGLVVIEKLVHFISPHSRVLPIKAREIQPQGLRLHETIPLIMIVVIIIELSTTVVLMVPTKIGNELAIIAVTAMDSLILSTWNNRKREHALIAQGRSLWWWSRLSGDQSAEHVQNFSELLLEGRILGVLLLLEGINSVLLLDDGVLAFFQGFRELKQSGAVGHEKKKKKIPEAKGVNRRSNGCGNFGFDTKCKGIYG
jgi:hypothetical protein